MISQIMMSQTVVSVLPYPNNIKMGEGDYRIGKNLAVKMPETLKSEMAYMKDVFAAELDIACKAGNEGIVFVQDEQLKLEANIPADLSPPCCICRSGMDAGRK